MEVILRMIEKWFKKKIQLKCKTQSIDLDIRLLFYYFCQLLATTKMQLKWNYDQKNDLKRKNPIEIEKWHKSWIYYVVYFWFFFIIYSPFFRKRNHILGGGQNAEKRGEVGKYRMILL